MLSGKSLQVDLDRLPKIRQIFGESIRKIVSTNSELTTWVEIKSVLLDVVNLLNALRS